MMSLRRGTMRSVSRRGAALRTALAATTGTCSPRTTPNGSLRGSAGREGASDSVLRQKVGQFQFLDKVVVERWLGCGYSHPLVQAVRGSRLSVMEAFGRIFCSALPASSRCSQLGNWTLRLRPRFFKLVMVFGCCLWSTASCVHLTWFDSGYMVFERLWTNFSIFYVVVNSNPEAFGLHSC